MLTSINENERAIPLGIYLASRANLQASVLWPVRLCENQWV